jgi:DNA-directed RNA polymerase subunit RPC12/RpoP
MAMTVDFRCDKCGKLLSVEAQPGSETKCPHCNKTITVPAGLASLPRPNVPPDAQPAGSPAEPAADGQEPEQDEPEAMVAVMSRLMPFVISAFFHVGLALVFALVTLVSIEQRKPRDIAVPESPPDKKEAQQYSQRDVDIHRKRTQSASMIRHRARTPHPVRGDRGKRDPRLAIAQGPASGAGRKWSNRYGGGGLGNGSFFQLGGGGSPVHHYVYVIDRSGSMTGTLDEVRKEMMNSIGRLGPLQDFHVVFFNEGAKPVENPPGRLVRANRENKRDLARFLKSIIAMGQTDPIPALKRAFAVLRQANAKPGKRIYLLTDGDFPDNDAVLAAVRRLNASKSVQIYTFLFQFKGKRMVDLMQTIAKENNGHFKLIDPDV